jgi:hypothetical protein
MRQAKSNWKCQPRYPRGFVLQGGALTYSPAFCPGFRWISGRFSTVTAQQKGRCQ